MRNPIRKWIPVLAVILGFVMALGLLGATPSGRALFSAAMGLAEAGQLGDPSLINILLGWVWRLGGSAALSFLLWAGCWLVWAVGFFLIFAAASLVVNRHPGLQKVGGALLGIAVVWLCGNALWNAGWNWNQDRRDLTLVAPFELARLAQGEGHRIFANPSAHATLWLADVEPGASLMDSAILSTQPSRWRSALRQNDWNAVILAGPPSEFQPLLEHLLTSPDWRLEALTNWGWLFRREPGPSNPLPKPEAVDRGSPVDSAIYLSQLSARFDVMKATVPARAAMERALELAPNDANVRIHAATFALVRERWQDVVAHARGALRANRSMSQAHALAARGYLESGDLDSAEKSATSALTLAPSDLSTRFLLARIQRSQGAYRAEAETLERLVSDSKNAGLPTAGHLAYLGQSYAQVGNAASAAKNYREALASNQLNEEQKAAVLEALEIIQTRSPDLRDP
ncbi:MAG: hypothetical protein WEB60_07045, partial [Terrimicrobiaceae bacterium]